MGSMGLAKAGETVNISYGWKVSTCHTGQEW